MGRLTTHVLNTMTGLPAGGLKLSLWQTVNGEWRHLKDAVTNDNGRVEEPLLRDKAMTAGVFELRFEVGAYLRDTGEHLPKPPFLDVIPVRFGISEPERHHHIPLLLSAYGYSTYRGS